MFRIDRCFVYTDYINKLSYTVTLFKFQFIQDSVLFRVLSRSVYTGFTFYSEFCLDRFIQDSVLFRVRSRSVYTGFTFYSEFGLDRIHVLFRVRSRQVYTGFTFYSEFGLDRFIQDSRFIQSSV